MHRLPLTRTAAALVLLGAACQGAPPKEAPPAVSGVVATVNDRQLTEEDLALQPAARGHQQGGPETREAILEALITEELAAQKAAGLGLEPDPRARRELARLEAAVTSARRRALANAWYAQVTRQALEVSPAEVEAYRGEHRQELRRQVHLLMALARTAAEIEQLQQALDAGAPLEQVLRARSAGLPGTPWDLGWLGHAQLAPAWRPVVARLKPGEVSGPIDGDHQRFWLLQLVEEREGPALEPEAEQALVRQLLGAARALPARAAAEAALRAQARVAIPKQSE